MPRLSFYPVGGDSYLLVIAAALVLIGLLALAPAPGRTAKRRRRVLLWLRVGVIVLVILAMLRPTLVYTKTTKQAATLILLADQSLSMSVPDEVNGRTRWQALRRALAAAEDPLRKLDEEFEVKAYAFDAQATGVEVTDGKILLPEEPDGDQTAIGSVLEDVLRLEAGKRLLGVILLSDGAQRAYPPRDVLPQAAAGQLRHVAPLFAFRFGRSRGLGQAQDVAVTELLADQRVFVKNQLIVTAQVRADGYVNRQIPVQLLVEKSGGEMAPVDRVNLDVTADGELLPVEFSYVPQVPGEIKVSLEAVGQPGELVTTNNRLSTFVNVLKGGLNVLYLEGVWRPETKFLRWALDASPDISLDYVRIDARNPKDRPADFAERFKPGKYDVYILGDLDSSVFQASELKELAQTVDGGAGLIMMGGFHSFGPGGYARTPLAAVLPVQMAANERQRLQDPIRTDVHFFKPLKMLPTPEIGLRHFALMLADSPRESASVWAELPPLDGANKLKSKLGARVLATTGEGQPLLLDRVYGNGRVMAFAGDSTSRWWMHGHQAAHKRFWRQVILWLARKDESLEGSVWIKLPQRRFSAGQHVQFSVGAESPTGEPLPTATYEANVVLPDGTERRVPLVRSGQQMTGSFRQTRTAGDYTIRVKATQDDQMLGTAQARFLVFEQNLELDHAVADATMLDSLAAMTGGQSLAPEELPKLLARLTERTENLEVRSETKKTLWDTWTLLLLVVGLLGTEWFLRKRWGLV